MNEDFVNLVKTEYEKGESCFYIGEGNPDADILIIGNECAIGDNDYRLQNDDRFSSINDPIKRRESVIAAYNVLKWKEFLDRLDREDVMENLNEDLVRLQSEPNSNELKYKARHHYYPLFPEFGQKSNTGKDGTAATWMKYQKLKNFLYNESFSLNKPIDFHLKVFHTELSQIPCKHSGKYNKETDDNIQMRMKKLFSNPFFQKFPVVIIAAGHYVKKYKIDNSTNRLTIEKVFDVEYNKDDKGKSGWINLHKSSDSRRLLLHTKHFAAAITDDYIKGIAILARHQLEG